MSEEAYEQILYSVEDPIATITLNRPEQLNAWTDRMGAEVRHAFARAEQDPSVVAIILTGAGRGFCAGADLKGLQAISAGEGGSSIPDWLGLMGDPADGIPGIPGFGAKSAATVLAHYERIEDIPDDAEKWEVAVRGAKRLAASLAERREEALLYKRLATLAEDAPISRRLAELEWKGVPRGAFEDFCVEMNADRLRTRPRRWAGLIR